MYMRIYVWCVCLLCVGKLEIFTSVGSERGKDKDIFLKFKFHIIDT